MILQAELEWIGRSVAIVWVQYTLLYLLVAAVTWCVSWSSWRLQGSSVRRAAGVAGSRSIYRDAFWSLVSILIFALVFGVVYAAHLRGYTMIDPNTGRHGLLRSLVLFVAVLLLHDAYFYVTHRILHIGPVYRWVHASHHRSTSPTPWSAFSFHPVEALVQAGIYPLIAFTLPVSFDQWAQFSVIVLIVSAYIHSGYRPRPSGSRKPQLPGWLNSSADHLAHHDGLSGNFGFLLSIWDRLFGTYVDPGEVTCR